MCNDIDCELNMTGMEVVDKVYSRSNGFFAANSPYRQIEFSHDGEWELFVKGYIRETHLIPRHIPCDAVWKWLCDESGCHIEIVQLLATYEGACTAEQRNEAKQLTERLVKSGKRHESDFNLFRDTR